MTYKGNHKFMYKLFCTFLCVCLLGTNVTGALAESTVKPVVYSEDGIVDDSPSIDEQNTEDNTFEIANEQEETKNTENVTDDEAEIENNPLYIISYELLDTQEFLVDYDGELYLSLPGANKQDLSEELIIEMLPKEVKATLSNDEEKVLSITWDLSDFFGDNVEMVSDKTYRFVASIDSEYAYKENLEQPYVLFTFGGAETYDVYPGTRKPITGNKDEVLKQHQVKGMTPEGSVVDLFDYSFTGTLINGDVLPDGAKFKNYSTGINASALLLFGGSAMREAGFWNLGSGAGRPWGKANLNMNGIVKRVLENGYPYINLDDARSELPNATGTAVDDWGNETFMDIANLNHAEYENAGVDVARALSIKLLNDRRLTVDASGKVSGTCEKASLQYLFDADVTTDGKTSHKNVTGLFQMDENGYYYYDARKNFAEFNQSTSATSDGSFTLYDGPAVWRTDSGYNPITNKFDGDKSLGNFFPFDEASKVFDSIQTADKNGNPTNILSSSETITNVSNGVDANHYFGMKMTMDFTQPENGKLNMGSSGKQDMIFEFSGDDDVWIFVDDVLVIDLGGIHSELYGTINFSTGEVITGQSWRTNGLPNDPGNMEGDRKTTLYELFVDALGQEGADAIRWTTNGTGEKIFSTGTMHNIKLFYLERGNYDSSLSMRFNLQPQLYHSIKKVDQNGNPLENVEFELYAAEAKNGNSTDIADYEIIGEKIGTLITGKDGTSSFVRTDGSPFSFIDRYHQTGVLHYILKETKTAAGYRSLPKDIVLRFDPNNSMLVVANRYQTGAYASFFSNIRETGEITYGQFDTGTGAIVPSDSVLQANNKKNGLIVAVPMLLQGSMSNGKWVALYGSNADGYGAIVPRERSAEAWREAILKAALYQASDERWPGWYITYNDNDEKLEGLLQDLPGRSDRYLLTNKNGDMKMVYGIIEESALDKLGITGNNSAELYDALEKYVSDAVANGINNGQDIDEVINEIIDDNNLNISSANFVDRDFSFLNTDQFQREFRSIIHIPNERRELRVLKVDEDGKGINGVEFTLVAPDGTEIKGTTANIDGQDGMLIFRPDVNTANGYAEVNWADVNSKYVLKETNVPQGYKKNMTEIPVIVGIYSIYADAGSKEDGVTVMAGVGKLAQTMVKYAADDIVNITLRDITAIAQVQKTGNFSLDGWQDEKLAGTNISRSMNLHYGINAVVDYGLHDEDGGQNMYPFFTTDEGFLRTRIIQNTYALQNAQYHNGNNKANWDNLDGMDLTNLFSLQNTVVVTNKKEVSEDNGSLKISKLVSGSNLKDSDYAKNFSFTVELKNSDGSPLDGEYYYYGEQRAGYISDGETLSLGHDEALTILGLPNGTKWAIREKAENGWSLLSGNEVISGTIETNKISLAAFVNYKGIKEYKDDNKHDNEHNPVIVPNTGVKKQTK